MSYSVSIDNINCEEWESYAANFADYSIYQTWAYQQVRAEMDSQRVSRVVIKNGNGRVVAMSQARIKHVKSLGLRIGYVQFGPLVCGKDRSLECSAEALKMLRDAYLGTSVNVLRVIPNVRDDQTGQKLGRLLEDGGFGRAQRVVPYHTVLVPLHNSEQKLREQLHQSWRRKLKKSEAVGLKIRESTDAESFRIMERLYLDMVRRKGFKGLQPREFTRTQHSLSTEEKMKLIVVYCNERPVTAHLTSNLGDTAILLLAASNEDGLAYGASYLAWWQAILASSRQMMKKYDVGGIDFRNNPTVSRFKAGLGGELSSHVGAFDVCSGKVVKQTWRAAEVAYRLLRQ